MAVPGEIPSNLPQKPTNIPSSDNKGLSVGATVGIGIGIALLVILGAIGAWMFVRRRRRAWAQKRKKQGDLEIKGETPNEEITKKILGNDKSNGNGIDKERRIEGAVEIGGGEQNKADLGQIDPPPRHGAAQNEKTVYEMSTAPELVEIGEGSRFVAELEGSTVPRTAARIEKNDTCPDNARK
jgi:hypothetical protein